MTIADWTEQTLPSWLDSIWQGVAQPYISVCRRCYPSRNWQPIYEALQQAVEEAGVDVTVMNAGCLEVCKLGPVVFCSGDRTWYTRVTSAIAKQIVNDHLVNGEKVTHHLYPPMAETQIRTV